MEAAKKKLLITAVIAVMLIAMSAVPVLAATYQLDDWTRVYFSSSTDDLTDSDGYFLACNKAVGSSVYSSNCLLALKADKSGTRLTKPFQKQNALNLQRVRFYKAGGSMNYKVKLGDRWLRGSSGVTASSSSADIYRVTISTKSDTIKLVNTRTGRAYQVWGKGSYWRMYYTWSIHPE